jgi:hypothetical protein
MNIRSTRGKMALSVILALVMLIASLGIMATPASAAKAFILTATESGNTVTVTTNSTHNFTDGQFLFISGVSVAGYNGTFPVTGTPSPTVFTCTNPASGLAPASGGTAEVIDLTITKSADPATFSAAGEVIVYTYVIKNEGDVTLYGGPSYMPFYVIDDDKLGKFQCGTATCLAPGAAISCTMSYTTQPGDVSSGQITNQATTRALFNNAPTNESSGIIIFSNRATATVNMTSSATPLPPMGVGGEVQPSSTAGTLVPWLILALILGFGGTILVMRRRKS